MTYRCLIVDDEKLGRELIKSHLTQFPFLELVGECNSAIEAMQFLAKEEVDVMFLDINMPHLSGVEFLKQSKKVPLTILCTAYSEYAMESYELDVVDYLLKPIGFARFSKAIGKIMTRLNQGAELTRPVVKTAKYIFVKSEYKKVKIDIDSIIYVQAMEKYVRIFTDELKVMTLMSMSSILEMLPPEVFMRVHRSYIVNIDKVESIDGNLLKVGDESIPVSKGNRKEFKEKMKF